MASGLSERSQIHKREDVLDLITRVDEKLTPFTSRVKKGGTPQNTYLQWPVDLYDAPKLGGVVDGTDVSTFEDHAKDRKILSTYLQTFRRTAKVTPLAQEVSDVAGIKDEMADAVSKKLVEIARDIEATCLSDQEHQADDGTDEYLTRGLGTWIRDTTNLTYSGGQVLHAVDAAYRPLAAQMHVGTVSSLTEDDLQTILQSIYDQTGMSGRYVLPVGSNVRRQITDMTRFAQYASANTPKASRQVNINGSDTSIVNTVSVYEGDYGVLEVVSCNFIGSAAGTYGVNRDRGYVLDMDKVILASHKQPTVAPLTNEGGGERSYIEARCALKVLNPIGMGQIEPNFS
jgi:hypothetical protein